MYKSCQKRGGLCISHKAKCVPKKKCSVHCECSNIGLFEGVEFVLPIMVLKSETEETMYLLVETTSPRSRGSEGGVFPTNTKMGKEQRQRGGESKSFPAHHP